MKDANTARLGSSPDAVEQHEHHTSVPRRGQSEAQQPPESNSQPSKHHQRARRKTSPPKLTQQKLERHLWAAADILRGKIDSSDYKHYILGLLFYKRICDVWQEEYDELLKRFQGDRKRAEDPRQHRFHIPQGAFWSDIRASASRIGTTLNRAFQAIEAANPNLVGVFQDADFTHEERFPDSTLEQLLDHFELIPLGRRGTEDDMLGNAYEFLIAQFADDAGKKGGEFYTPKLVTRLAAELIQPEAGMSVYDPTCGSGGMLLEAVNHVRAKGQDATTLKLYGQEMNLSTWAICKINLFIHDIDDAFIARGDTLRNPQHLAPRNPEARYLDLESTPSESTTTVSRTSEPTTLESTASESSPLESGKAEHRLMTFDRVLANPPFSLHNWGREAWRRGDIYGRDRYGCPPKKYGDLAFVQHMIQSLSEGGRLAVVLPIGILFRDGSEGEIRRGMLRDDLIEAVIGLPEGLFYGTSISTCMLVIRRDKPVERQRRILFVDGSREVVDSHGKRYLNETNVERLVDAYRAFEDVLGWSSVIDLDLIEAQGGDLTLLRYIVQPDWEESIDVNAELEILNTLQEERNAAEAELVRLLHGLGYGS